MFTSFYAVFVLVTVLGTLVILSLAGIPWHRLHEADSQPWKMLQILILMAISLAALVDLLFEPRPWGESIFHWAFLPLGLFMWARCISLLSSHNAE